MKQPKIDKRSDRIPKHTKNLVTVSTLFTSDGIRDILDKLNKAQTDMQAILCIYTDHNGNYQCITSDQLSLSDIVAMLERTKYIIQREADKDEGCQP